MRLWNWTILVLCLAMPLVAMADVWDLEEEESPDSRSKSYNDTYWKAFNEAVVEESEPELADDIMAEEPELAPEPAPKHKRAKQRRRSLTRQLRAVASEPRAKPSIEQTTDRDSPAKRTPMSNNEMISTDDPFAEDALAPEPVPRRQVRKATRKAGVIDPVGTPASDIVTADPLAEIPETGDPDAQEEIAPDFEIRSLPAPVAREMRRRQERAERGPLPSRILTDPNRAPAAHDPDPVVYESLSPEGLLVEYSEERREQVEEMHRRELLLAEKCPLVLFFDRRYGGAAVRGQMESVPAGCQQAYQEWKRATVHLDEERLRSLASVKEQDRAEAFDLADGSVVRIDGDGLAWVEEYTPPRKVTEAQTYVMVLENGMRYELRDNTDTITREIPADTRWRLVPELSRERSLRQYNRRVGRSVASEFKPDLGY